jgi:hypothetical protein
MLCIVMLSSAYAEFNAFYRYAEYQYAECRGAVLWVVIVDLNRKMITIF